MSKVYIYNNGGHDYSAAKEFGEIVFITQGNIAKTNTGNLFRHCVDLYDTFKPDDIVMMTGLTVSTSILTSMFVQKFGKVNILVHRSDNNTYVKRTIDYASLERVKNAS